MPDYKPPKSWVNGNPPEHVWACLKRYPVAVPCTGVPDVMNPRGSGYYAVVKIELASHSTLYRDFHLRTVTPCKEQLLNRYTSETVEAWPLDALTIVPAASLAISSQLGPIPEGVISGPRWTTRSRMRRWRKRSIRITGTSNPARDYTQEVWGADGADFNL